MITKPTEKEYGGFYKVYIDLVKGEDALSQLVSLHKETGKFLKSIPDDLWDYAYAEDKWVIKEIMVHLIDTERVFAYRALRLARMDELEMPGFDQDLFVGNSRARLRTPKSIIKEYKAVRSSTIQLFKQLENPQLDFIGKASNAPISGRALAWIMVGHEMHHLMVIRQKYLNH